MRVLNSGFKSEEQENQFVSLYALVEGIRNKHRVCLATAAEIRLFWSLALCQGVSTEMHLAEQEL